MTLRAGRYGETSRPPPLVVSGILNGILPSELNHSVNMTLSVNRENGELGGLREANDLNRGGSVRYPARAVSKRRKRQNPKYCRMLGLQPRGKNTISSRSTCRVALQLWKLAPRDEQNTYRSPGEIDGGRILPCKQRGCSNSLVGTRLAASGGTELAEKIKKRQLTAGKLGGPTARMPEFWRAT